MFEVDDMRDTSRPEPLEKRTRCLVLAVSPGLYSEGSVRKTQKQKHVSRHEGKTQTVPVVQYIPLRLPEASRESSRWNDYPATISFADRR